MNEKKQIIIILLLLLVLIAVWVVVLRPPKKNADMVITEENGLELKVILEMAEKYFNEKETVQEFPYERSKDPFSIQKRNISEEQLPVLTLEALVLQGILWDAKRPLAIVNGQTVREGDFIEEVQIRKIGKDHVVVGVGDNQKVLFIEGVEREGINSEKQE
jgi:hypothetical protein